MSRDSTNVGHNGGIDSGTQPALNEQVVGACQFNKSSCLLNPCRKAHALAESRHLVVDPSRLEDVENYPLMIGGFGTVRVAKLDDKLVAVKEIRITGARADRARFSMVRHRR